MWQNASAQLQREPVPIAGLCAQWAGHVPGAAIALGLAPWRESADSGDARPTGSPAAVNHSLEAT